MSKPLHRCNGCGETFKSPRDFETHAPQCTSGGQHKPLGEMSNDELMAMYREPTHFPHAQAPETISRINAVRRKAIKAATAKRR
jgi:hypothetical protein